MKRIIAGLFGALAWSAAALAQIQPGSGISINQTPVQNGTSGRCLYINGAVVGQQVCGAGTATDITVGTTTVTGGTTSGLIYKSSGGFVGTMSGWTTDGANAVTGGASTSVAIGGCAIGTNALCFTGTLNNSSFLSPTSPNSLFIGNGAGNQTLTGIDNTAIGFQSGQSLTVQNAGVSPAVHANTFLGYQAGKATTAGDANVFLGYQAGVLNDSGRENTFIGYAAGATFTNTGAAFPDTGQNTFIGSFAGSATNTGGANVFIGQKAGTTNTTGANNTYIGTHAGTDATTAARGVFIGNNAGDHATSTGNDNILIGSATGQYITGTAAANLFIGTNAGKGSSGTNNTASNNVGLGYQAGLALSTGTQNVFIGHSAGDAVTSGFSNTLVGYQAGHALTQGVNNTLIGVGAGSTLTTAGRNVCIGTSSCDTLPITSQNYFVSGSGGSGGAERIDNVHFGKGYASTAATGYTIRGTGGSGTDNVGGSVTIASGLSTGAGTNPDLIFATGIKIASGTGFATQTTALTIKGETLNLVGAATTDASASSGSGALQIAGGASIAKRFWIPAITASAGLQTAVLCQSSGGEMIADSVACLASSEDFKESIQNSDMGLDTVMALNPITYRYRETGNERFDNAPNQRAIHAGFGANQVASVDARLVGYGPDGKVRTVRQDGIIAVLAKAIQELKAANDNLHEEIVGLKKAAR